MKKILFFALLLTAGLTFTACGSDDDDNTNTDNGNDTPSVEELVENELDVFTDRLISVDDLGNLKGVNVGMVLNDIAPTVYSVKVSDIDEAKEMFMELVEDFQNISTSGNNITVVLLDSEGKEQGRVYFRETGGDEVASMTFEGFTLKGITELKYVAKWPASNATSRYKLFEVMSVPSDKEGNPRGICIREYSSGTNGMIICPTSYESGYQSCRSNTGKETMKSMGKQVKAVGVDKVKERLEKAGIYSDLTKYYWSNTTKMIVVDKVHYKVRLSDGDDKSVSSWEVALNKNNANNCYTYYFNDKGKCW